MPLSILHVGSDNSLLAARTASLQKQWTVTSVHHDSAMQELLRRRFNLVLICYSIPGDEADELENEIGQLFPELPVIRLESADDDIVLRGLGLKSLDIHQITESLRRRKLAS